MSKESQDSGRNSQPKVKLYTSLAALHRTIKQLQLAELGVAATAFHSHCMAAHRTL